ncbi:hypothetical protein BTA51_03460 [Hahella sp. CCB-MM4]|uniref:hypothetical protein n=1 Tax=Hahella sp. (strain CCB-MM4) TaxID=1926491 RepID=UPI000B9AD6A1|nr:hypothetical protein [Hahella sp. CCB-MM4]OZG75442.1 hypothetical protein BTA51_03460 [Hahella sp. CCB-MM4]
MTNNNQLHSQEASIAVLSLFTAMNAYYDSLDAIDLLKDSGVWAVSRWEPYIEDPDFISLDTAVDVDGKQVADIRFGNPTSDHAAIGAVFFKKSGLDLCTVLGISFNLKIKSFANAGGLAVKLVFDGEPASNAHAILDNSVSLNAWHHIRFSLSDCPELSSPPVTLVIEIMPLWNSDMRGVHFQLDNIQFKIGRYSS